MASLNSCSAADAKGLISEHAIARCHEDLDAFGFRSRILCHQIFPQPKQGPVSEVPEDLASATPGNPCDAKKIPIIESRISFFIGPPHKRVWARHPKSREFQGERQSLHNGFFIAARGNVASRQV